MKSAIVVIAFFALVGFVSWLYAAYRKKKMDLDVLRKTLPAILIAIFLTGCGFEQVDEGYRGVYTNFGKVEGEPLTPGMHFYNPFTADIFEMDVREKKYEGTTEAFTRDTQKVSVNFTVTYYPQPEKVGYLYSQFGKDWDVKIVGQAVLGGIKDAIGQVIADDLVSKRETSKASAENELKASLIQRYIVVTRLDFTNLDFDDGYEKAVEQKVIAIQKSAEAVNKTVQVKEEAIQKVMAAKADAEAMRIKSQALSQNKGLVSYEAIQKWDGKLPQIMFGNSTPIINMDKLLAQ